jgi:two-component system phosphate regulon sensor histidine kinase PhoR
MAEARRKLWFVIALPFLILITLVLLAFGVYSSSMFEEFTLSEVRRNLRSQAQIVSRELTLGKFLTSSASDTAAVQRIADEVDKITGSRITVIMPGGKVIADSRQDFRTMDNHADRLEVREAIQKGEGYSVRYSQTVKAGMLYYAAPVYYEGRVIAYIRTAASLEEIEGVARRKYTEISAAGVLILVIAGLLSVYLSRRLTKPMRQMRERAEKFAGGDFSHKVYAPNIAELQGLAGSLNLMASQLEEKMRLLTEQTKLREAVLESMKEGVLAVDYNQRMLLVNKSAVEILSLTKPDRFGKTVGFEPGRTLQESIRIPDVHYFFSKILAEGATDEAEVVLSSAGAGDDRTLQMRGTPLYDSENNRIGALVVVNDITELKHFDNLKRDFVANVSHELKTPITAIKGFIETLKEGAVNEPANAKKFLDIVSKHADRLNLIVEDLLSLSRLEQKSSIKEIKFLNEPLRGVLQAVIDDFALKARDKHITLSLECSEKISADINRPLIEEAVGNLLDNAIKYSDSGKKIAIKAETIHELSLPGKKEDIAISVSDEGPGIAPHHHARIFERFYRIDKARSREAGGTGLGLAIVKHIAQVHGGTVSVESELGKGSTFTIRIPKQQSILTYLSF